MAWANSCVFGNFYSLKQCQPSSCILSKCLCQINSAHRGGEGGVINEDIMVFQEQDFFIQMLMKTCHEILVLEVLEILVVGKGLVVFITSSNCLWKSLSEKEYDEYAHNKIYEERYSIALPYFD